MTKKLVALVATAVLGIASTAFPQDKGDIARWERAARNITIVRDDWGIPHIHGKTDAQAVFGLMYAQAEDDFNRIETNYIDVLGRASEAEGEAAIYRDLRMKIFNNADTLKAKYTTSPTWLKALMDGYADGLNYYLYKHPSVTPKVIKHFEPWMALALTEGSVPLGGDIQKVNVTQLQAFYGGESKASSQEPQAEPTGLPPDPGGSNGIAIAPSNTTAHHALLLINPHTSFFFRAEVQMTSDEGLNAYGAATWGQFFIYQGFNEHAGWMHTSSGVDAVDEYAETITKKGDAYVYKYGSEERPVITTPVSVPYKSGTGVATKTFTVYRTQHGPVVRELDGKWVTVRMMQEPVKALTQSYSRTKSKNLGEFLKIMELHTNSSNNTLFADAEGNIAYLHANFIPRRDPNFDWSRPVDGSDPATDWKGVLAVNESPNAINPPNGWAFNVNNWPWSAAGENSPKRENFPVYVENGRSESARGVHATRVLQGRKDFTLDGLVTAAYDSYLPYFAERLPGLLQAYDALASDNPLKARVADQIGLLRAWDYRWAVSSIPTSLAIFWAEEVARRSAGGRRGGGPPRDSSVVTGEQLVQALAAASDKLAADFGAWKTPWGDINRFQRLTDDIVHPFNDAGPSIPVGFTSSTWGSLAAFSARAYPGTKKWYGTSGNSFVAVVEFGTRVRARAVTAGGESGDVNSKHFNDEALRYSTGNLREVYFYPAQLKGHTERTYHPGE